MADALRQEQGAVLCNAEGRVGMGNIWGETFTWVDHSAKIKGQLFGIEVFDHPGTPNHPTD